MNEIAYFTGRRAVLATMHGKEQVIAPLFAKAFNMHVFVPDNLNTDRFGTFTRDVKRPSDQRSTARLKAMKAMAMTTSDVGIASEGSFGMDPSIPFVPSNTELVILIDRLHGIEIIGGHLSLDTHMHHAYVTSVAEALAFAADHDFPHHGIVLRRNERSVRGMRKDITTLVELEQEVSNMLRRRWVKSVFLESDMRGHRNPTRLSNIAKATEDLIRKMNSFCPQCGIPGFDYIEIQKGLPCNRCALPTDNVLAHVYRCQRCLHQNTRLFPYGKETANPAECQYCNP